MAAEPQEAMSIRITDQSGEFPGDSDTYSQDRGGRFSQIQRVAWSHLCGMHLWMAQTNCKTHYNTLELQEIREHLPPIRRDLDDIQLLKPTTALLKTIISSLMKSWSGFIGKFSTTVEQLYQHITGIEKSRAA